MGVRTVGTASRQHATYTLWESFVDGVLTEKETGEGYDDSLFSEKVAMSGSTTTSAFFLLLSVASGEEHDGTINTGVRLEDQTGGGNGMLRVLDDHCVCELVEVRRPVSSTATQEGARVEAPFCRFHRILVHNVRKCFSAAADPADDTQTINNCIGFDCDLFFVSGYSANTDGLQVFNCSAVQSTADDSHDQPGLRFVLAKNCAMFHFGPTGNTRDFFQMNSGSEYNISSDESADDDDAINSLISKIAADNFVDIAVVTDIEMDLHILTGADMKNVGLDLGTTPTDVNIDIDGRDRDTEGDTWDMGADEFVVCEILVKLQDSTSPHPNSSKRGDIVSIKPDGHEYGRLIRPPAFGVVVLEGVPASNVTRWMAAWEKIVQFTPGEDTGVADGVDSHKKGCLFDVDALPLPVRTQLEVNSGRIVLGEGAVRDHDLDAVLDLVVEKKTGLTERQRGTTLPDLKG